MHIRTGTALFYTPLHAILISSVFFSGGGGPLALMTNSYIFVGLLKAMRGGSGQHIGKY